MLVFRYYIQYECKKKLINIIVYHIFIYTMNA